MKRKTVPRMTNDAQAEAFLQQDLSGLVFSQVRAERFETAPRDTTVTLRMPVALLSAIKDEAAERGIPYQRLIRETLDAALHGKQRPG